MNIPTEAEEQIIVVQYCDLNNIPCWRTPNETFTRSWKQKMNNKRLGVKSGVPDLFVITKKGLIAIEMKRIKKSTVSPTQQYWLKILNDAGVPARVCYGAKEAIAFIKEFTS